MPEERLTMKRLKEVLRLKYTAELSNRQIARAVNISPGTVSYYSRAAAASGLSWAVMMTLDDEELVLQLEPHCQQLQRRMLPRKAEVDYATLHHELKRKGVTLQLLHEEYVARYKDRPTHSYSVFCSRYRQFAKRQSPSMRQVHTAGEKVFVDYVGPSISIHDATTGGVMDAKIFVAAMGASHYVFAEATMSRSIPDWIGSHVRMLEFFGGVPSMIVPDNEKAGVQDACYYDPELNPNYAAFAAHYDTVILPARPRKPKDKAKVENAVLLVERWIMARLRHMKFFTLPALNSAISVLLTDLNSRKFKKLPGSRRSLYEALDLPALKPLCQVRYEVSDFKWLQVRLDYHIEYDNHCYSVPHALIGQKVECRSTRELIQVYHAGKRIASHRRSFVPAGATTLSAHMPTAHRLQQEWTPAVFTEWAKRIDPSVLQLAEKIIVEQPHPECCYRIHRGLSKLAKRFGVSSFVKACQYANTYLQTPGYRSMESILKTKIYQQQTDASAVNLPLSVHPHENLRGATYYATAKEVLK